MRKHFFLIALATLSIVSCKKDATTNNNGGGNPPPIPVPTSKQLKKMTQTENGVTTIYNFAYDNAKQLTSITASDNSEVTHFSYDADGNVIKTESTTPEVRIVYQYTYENGIPASGTFKSYGLENGAETLTEDDVIHYTVENGKVTKINMDMNVQQQELNFVLLYDAAGNLTKIKTDGSDNYTAEFTYGTKKPIFPKVFKFVLDQAGYSTLFYAKNELLSQRYDFPGTDNDATSTEQYTYDSNGYALTSTDGTTQTTYSY